MAYRCGGAMAKRNILNISSEEDPWQNNNWVSICFDVLQMIPSVDSQSVTVQVSCVHTNMYVCMYVCASMIDE